MAAQIPLKANYTGAAVVALAEFSSADYVPITQGGTGAITAAAARTALGAAGLTSNTFTAAQIGTPTALAVSANAVAVDLSLANNFTLTLQVTTGQTLSNPTNAVAGQSGHIFITQSATPSTLGYGSNWKPFDGTTPAVSTTASAKNVLSYTVQDATTVWYSLAKAGVA